MEIKALRCHKGGEIHGDTCSQLIWQDSEEKKHACIDAYGLEQM